MTSLLAADVVDEVPGTHLLTSGGQTTLRGGECGSCRKRFFPLRRFCPYCGADSPAAIALPMQGRLYAYSTVRVAQNRPVPYRIGYVDFEGDVRVLGRLLGAEPELTLDRAVRLAVTADGDWAFEPASQLEPARG